MVGMWGEQGPTLRQEAREHGGGARLSLPNDNGTVSHECSIGSSGGGTLPAQLPLVGVLCLKAPACPHCHTEHKLRTHKPLGNKPQ